jgi:hypothetical protein
MPKALGPRQLNLLFELEAELPSQRQNLDLAKIIANHPFRTKSAHPVVNFAFERAPVAIVLHLILRCVEAVELIDQANKELGLPPLLGRGRDAKPSDPDFAMVWRLRHELVAHRVKLAPKAIEASEAMTQAYGDYFVLLASCLNKLGTRLQAIRTRGLFNGLTPSTVAKTVAPFSEQDVSRLVTAANQLVSMPPSAP